MDTIYGRFEWDEAKRQLNFKKHRLDFKDAAEVYDNPIKVTIQVVRSGELRYVDVSILRIGTVYVTLVHVPRGERIRIISFRVASRRERKRYDLARQQN